MTARVTAAAVQVKVGGRVHTVFRGFVLPAGVDGAVVDRLAAKGLVEPEAEATPEAEPEAEAEATPRTRGKK